MRFCFIVALFRYCFWSKSQQGGKIGVRDYSFFFDNRYFVGIDICYASSLYAYHGRGMKVVYSHAYDSDFALLFRTETKVLHCRVVLVHFRYHQFLRQQVFAFFLRNGNKPEHIDAVVVIQALFLQEIVQSLMTFMTTQGGEQHVDALLVRFHQRMLLPVRTYASI